MAIPRTGDSLLGRYRLMEEIGGGAYSVVFRAEQLGVGREVAVKVLARPADGDSAVADRFVREVKLLARLRHPNTIMLLDSGRTDAGEPFFVTEFVPGATVEKLLRDEGALCIERTFRIMRQVLGSLREAHLTGVVHRDLKPANIMVFDRIDEKEVVKLLDFGVATFLDEISAGMMREALTPRGELLGTPRYMAPEALAGRQATAATDIFSVGLIIFEMLTGEPAIEGDTHIEVLNRQFTGRPAIDPKDTRLPAPLHALLMRATDRTVGMRVPDASSLLRQLDSVQLALSKAEPDANKGVVRRRSRPITRARSTTVLGRPGAGTGRPGKPPKPPDTRPSGGKATDSTAAKSGAAAGKAIADVLQGVPLSAQTEEFLIVPVLDAGKDDVEPSAHAKVLARALFDDPQQDVSAYDGVDDLARSLHHRLSHSASFDAERTHDGPFSDDDGTIDVLIPEPDWDPDSRLDVTLETDDIETP